MNGAVTGPLAARPSPRPREPREPDADGALERTQERDAFWQAWEWSQPDEHAATGPAGRSEGPDRSGGSHGSGASGASEGSDVAALLPDDLLDADPVDRRWWGRRRRSEGHGRRPVRPVTGQHTHGGRRGRRTLVALGSLAVLSGGFLAGVVVDRAVSSDAARTVDPSGAGVSGRVEADANGTLAVVAADGRRQTVRTSPGTEVVSMNLLTGDLPPGTPVQVRTRTGTDGSLEATSVAVTGPPAGAAGAGSPVISGP